MLGEQGGCWWNWGLSGGWSGSSTGGPTGIHGLGYLQFLDGEVGFESHFLKGDFLSSAGLGLHGSDLEVVLSLLGLDFDIVLCLPGLLPGAVFQLNFFELLLPECVSHAVVPGQPLVGLDVGVPCGHDVLGGGMVRVLGGDGLDDHPDGLKHLFASVIV